MNQYLKVLELQPGVNEADIKRAYRRLAKKYHPDINTDPEAQQKFIAITEAYNFLMEVGAQPHREPVSYDYNPMAREYEERRRRAKEYARAKQQQAMRERQAILTKLYTYCNYFVSLVLILNLLLLIDFMLPQISHREQLLKISRSYQTDKPYSQNLIYRHGIMHFERHEILIDSKVLDDRLIEQLQSLSPQAEIRSSPLLDVVRSARIAYGNQYLLVEPVYSVYEFFFFLIPAIVLFALLYYRWPKTSDNKIGLVVLLLVFFAIQLLVFFSSG
jgi:hypothetical protein